jgi:hypothetical protein
MGAEGGIQWENAWCGRGGNQGEIQLLKTPDPGTRFSTRLWPGNPEATAALARRLMQSGRDAEAKQVLGKFLNEYPDQGKALELPGIKPEMVPAP